MSEDIFGSTCPDGTKCHHRCGGREDCFRETTPERDPDVSKDLFGDTGHGTALANAFADQELLIELALARREQFPDVESFAQEIGIDPADVRAFERLGADPRLSAVRRYARILGIQISHRVVHTDTEIDMDDLRDSLVALVPVQVHRIDGLDPDEAPRTVVPVRASRPVKGMNLEWADALYLDPERRIYELADGVFHRLDDEARFKARTGL